VSADVNSIHLVGEVVGTPRVTPGRVSCVSFTVRTLENANVAGEYKTFTTLHDCVVFGREADAWGPDIVAGARVDITGSMISSAYQKDGGPKIWSKKVKAKTFALLRPRPTAHETPGGIPDGFDDELPF